MDETFLNTEFRRCVIPYEDEDEFMFTIMSGYIDGIFADLYELHIPKKLLTRALTCFKEEHPQEFDILLKGEKEDA